MAIIQISRIQVRRGLQENLPQLSSAELGWSVDSRKLYIGNGTLDEGAPSIGNTEILTEYSMLTGAYTFQGNVNGNIVQTGNTTITPVTRTLNAKLDDSANAKDFGGVGDGVANEVASLNRAITELYTAAVLGTEPQVRRTLHLSAGTYNLGGDFLRLMPYVKLKGDGKNSTFIVQTDANVSCVVSSCDSSLNIGTGLGGNPLSGTIAPGYFEIEDLTLLRSTGNDIVRLNSVSNVFLNRVSMQGGIATPTTIDAGVSACIKFGQTQDSASSSITLTDCDFSGKTYGIYAPNDLTDVVVIGGNFTNLYQGINLGETYVGTLAISDVKVTHSKFDLIAKEGIYGHNLGATVTHVVSAFNHYKDVGNGRTATPTTAVNINFGGDNCYSIGDTFTRPYNSTLAAVNLNNMASFATLSNGRLQLGRQVFKGSGNITLPDNTVGLTSAGIIGVSNAPTTIEYSIMRGWNQRNGSLSISTIGTSVSFADDYVETADLGVTLTPQIAANVISLMYTTTSAASTDAYLKISSRTLV